MVFDDGEQRSPEDWQLDIAADIFAGAREVWQITPEGNGKSTFIAQLALYGADYSLAPRIPIGAASAKQARIVYDQAAGFVERTPGLEGRFRCFGGYKLIRSLDNGGIGIEVFAADVKTGDGVIPYPFALLDELHRPLGSLLSFEELPTICRSPRLSPAARSDLNVGGFGRMDWVRGQRLARGVLPPMGGAVSRYGLGLWNPCDLGCRAKARPGLPLPRTASLWIRSTCPALRQQDGAQPGNLEDPPLSLAFTSKVCSRHRGGGPRSSPTCAGRRCQTSVDGASRFVHPGSPDLGEDLSLVILRQYIEPHTASVAGRAPASLGCAVARTGLRLPRSR
jgi:hypothetical protein